jgi:colanic acid/amylovoran biosynthesis glycosyltransferase
MAQLAYLFPAFPVFHQTFVLWEVLGLRRNGVTPKIYSMRHGTTTQQPEGKEIARAVTYLPATLSTAVARANWKLLRREPRRYLRLYAEVVRAWRTGAVVRPRHSSGETTHVPLANRIRGWLNSQPRLYLLKSLWLVPTAVFLAEQLAEDGITHLHAHWASYPATVAYVVHLVSGLPFSISAHAYDIYMVPRMLPAKLQAARFLITCAQTNADFLTRLAGPAASRKIIVSYHGVDVSRFAPGPREAHPGRPLTIFSCGQLQRYKGMHILIDACAALTRRGTPLDCWIVGEGSQRRQLERQIERLGLTHCVHLVGARPHAAIADFLRSADVFVLASELAGRSGRRDVIANVIVEAMAAGLPVVAAHLPGLEELVEDGVTGYLVPPNRVEGFAAALAALASHPEDGVRFGQAGRRRVLRDFDSSKNVRLLASLLTKASDDEVHRLTAAVG